MSAQSPQDVDSVCGDRIMLGSFLLEISLALSRLRRKGAARPRHGYPHDRF
jgi:hypothetical protein